MDGVSEWRPQYCWMQGSRPHQRLFPTAQHTQDTIGSNSTHDDTRESGSTPPACRRRPRAEEIDADGSTDAPKRTHRITTPSIMHGGASVWNKDRAHESAAPQLMKEESMHACNAMADVYMYQSKASRPASSCRSIDRSIPTSIFLLSPCMQVGGTS